MKEYKNITNKIEEVRPVLGSDERLSMWKTIEATLPVATPVDRPIVSPFIMSLQLRKTYIMTPLAILLALILGGGATAYASDAAKPGDLLFPVERMVENTQMHLTFNADKKAELIKNLTEERLAELRQIVDDEVTVSPSNIVGETSSSTATSTDAVLGITARVFTDKTIVKLEFGGDKFYFETDATTRVDTLLQIQEKFPMLTDTDIDAALDFAVTDTESRPKDRGIVSLSPEGQSRIDNAINELVRFLDATNPDPEARGYLMSLVSSEVNPGVSEIARENGGLRIGNDQSRVEIRMDDNGASSVEIRDTNTRVRVEDKDGKVEVKTELDAVETNEQQTADAKALVLSAEIYTDITVVHVALGGQTFDFQTTETDRAAIITAIQAVLPALTTEEIEAVLSLTTLDRESTPAEQVTPVATSTVPVLEKKHDDDTDDDRYESEGHEAEEHKAESTSRSYTSRGETEHEDREDGEDD